MSSNRDERIMQGPSRRRLSTDQRRQELIEATIELLGTEPVASFSMDEVAKRANASRALLYHYFASKQELIRAAVTHESEALQTSLDATDLSDALDAYLTYAHTHPHGYRLLHEGTLQADPEIKATVEQTRSKIERAVIRRLRISNPTELERLAVRGWTGFVIAVCLEWAGTQHLPQQAIHSLLLKAHTAMMPANGNRP